MIEKKKQQIRMSDIAREAGVTRPVVSAVLTGSAKGKIRVAEATAQKIRSIAGKYHFQPNATAQMLAGKSSRIVGVIIDSYADTHVFETLGYFEEYLAASGYRMLVAQSHNNQEAFTQCLKDFKMYRVAGVLAFAHTYPQKGFDLYQELMEIPHVMLYGRPLRPGINLPYIEKDIEGGIEKAILHLYATGCRRIAINIGSKAYEKIPLTGYMRGLEKTDLPFDRRLLFFEKHSELADLPKIRRKLFQRKADAYITSEYQSVRLLSFFYDEKIRVPDEISILSLDSSMLGVCTAPSLTALNYFPKTQALRLYEMMLKVIAGETPEAVMLEAEISIGKSTKPTEGRS